MKTTRHLLSFLFVFLLVGCTPPGHFNSGTECDTAPEGQECGEPTALGEPSGRCHLGACCSGCWDGQQCHPGTADGACGLRGDACVRCADGYACTPADVTVDHSMVTAARTCQADRAPEPGDAGK